MEPIAPPAGRGGAWKVWSLAATVVAAVLAAALGFVLLANPHWLTPTPKPPVISESNQGIPLSTVLKVDDIPSLLVELDQGSAMLYYDEQGPGPVHAWIGYLLRVMKFEVTQGMYAECLTDVEQNRDRIPDAWLPTKEKMLTRDEVKIVEHAPLAWRIVDPDGAVVGWRHDPAQTNLPITQVTLHDAAGFAQWASKRLGLRLELPVWFEWMRAARGGNVDYFWPWGRVRYLYACNSRAFWGEGNRGALHAVQFVYMEPIGTGGATPEGLWGMAGNAMEMALDHDVEREESSPLSVDSWVVWKPKKDAQWAWGCGGSYKSGIDDCRCESRVRIEANVGYDDLGFRLVVRNPNN